MICKNCGFETQSKFCPNCGTRIQEEIAHDDDNPNVVQLKETEQVNSEEIYADNTQMEITEKTEDNSQNETYGKEKENDCDKANEIASTIVACEQSAITTKTKDSKIKFSLKNFFLNFYNKYYNTFCNSVTLILILASIYLLYRQITDIVASVILNNTITLRFLCIGTPLLILGVVFSIISIRLKYEAPKKDKKITENVTQINVKKFKYTCNYLVWGIYLLSFICLILAAATFLKSTDFSDTTNIIVSSKIEILNKLLAIIIIVLSSIMILIQLAFMIYEFVFLKTSDLDLTEDGKAQVEAICNKNKSSKIKLIASCLMIGILIISMAPVINWSGNKFAQFTNLEIGYSKETIIPILGQADVQEDNYWEYYGENYKKVIKELEQLTKDSLLSTIASNEEDDLENIFGELDKELGEADKTLKKIEKIEEKLQTMEYKYIRIEFDKDGKLLNALYESKKSEKAENKIKKVKSIKIKGNTTPQQYEKINVTYKIKYSDNSMFIGGVSDQLAQSIGKYPLDLPIINITKLTNLTQDIVTNIFEQYKGTETSEINYNIPDSVISIEDNAFKIKSDSSTEIQDVYKKLNSITISKNVKVLGKDLFANCVNFKEINYNGTKAEWNTIKKANNWNSGITIVIHCTDGDIN